MYICTQITTTLFIKLNIMYKVVKHMFDKELNAKVYQTKEQAQNASNSWERNCTVDQSVKKNRWFTIEKIN